MKFFSKSMLVLQLKKDKIALISFVVLACWIIVACLPLFLSQLSNIPSDLSQRLSGPSTKYWFGVDGSGQSVALLILNGALTSLTVSIFTVTTSLLLGVPLGAIAGYFGGFLDVIITRIIDILLAFPPLILPIAMTSFFGGGFFNVVASLSLTGWVSYARIVRGQYLIYKHKEFVLAAKSLGSSTPRIILLHIFPNTISPLLVQATFSLAGVIIAEAGLSFLGLGVSENQVSWGSLLNSASDYLTTNPSLAFFPAIALFSVVASLNFVGDALRVALDPKGFSIRRL